LFEIYKPKEILNLVLADNLYGESGKNFIQVLNELNFNFVVAIRSNFQSFNIPDLYFSSA